MNLPLQPASRPRRSPFNRITVIAFLAGAALAGGVAALAGAAGMNEWHHGMMGGAPGAAEVSAHVDRALKHLYAQVGASDAQKAQIAPLVKQAVDDLLPLHDQLRAAHMQAIDALTEPSIDRNALEAARAAHLELADRASKRFMQLVADVGDVLTPAQRSAFAAHLKQMHGMSGS